MNVFLNVRTADVWTDCCANVAVQTVSPEKIVSMVAISVVTRPAKTVERWKRSLACAGVQPITSVTGGELMENVKIKI